MMPDTVLIAPFTGMDQYGARTFGPDAPYQARVNNKTHFIHVGTPQQVQAKGTAIMACITPVSVNDRITMPDGSNPLILDVNQENDEVGALYTRLDLG